MTVQAFLLIQYFLIKYMIKTKLAQSNQMYDCLLQCITVFRRYFYGKLSYQSILCKWLYTVAIITITSSMKIKGQTQQDIRLKTGFWATEVVYNWSHPRSSSLNSNIIRLHQTFLINIFSSNTRNTSGKPKSEHLSQRGSTVRTTFSNLRIREWFNKHQCFLHNWF